MLAHESGTCSGSDLYFHTPSVQTREMLFYMTSCGYYYTDYDYHITRDYVEEFLLFYICDGRLSIRMGDKTIVATEGQICFLNCHLPHEYYTIGHTEFVWIHINGSNIQQLYDHVLDLYGAHVFHSTVAPQIKKDIFDFVYVCRNDQMMPDLEASHRIYRMILTLLSGIPQRKSILASSSKKSHRITDSVVSSAMQFIGNNYRHSISVTDIAQNVGMSKAHFSRIFKKQSGYAPHEYLIQIRLNRAKHLLKTTDMPIKNVSQEVGYQDVTTFTSAFTNRVGLSPAQFRNSSLGST